MGSSKIEGLQLSPHRLARPSRRVDSAARRTTRRPRRCDLLDDLVAYLDDDRHSPVVQAAIAHAQFETILPFADGNGRTGRALIHVVLRRRGLTPMVVPPISMVLATWADRYVGGLTAFRHEHAGIGGRG